MKALCCSAAVVSSPPPDPPPFFPPVDAATIEDAERAVRMKREVLMLAVDAQAFDFSVLFTRNFVLSKCSFDLNPDEMI